MRSRAVRWVFVLVAWAGLGAAAFFSWTAQHQLASASTSLRAVDLHAREAADALADLRAAQQAYVAAGQSSTFWIPKVASTADAARNAIVAMRQSVASREANAALDEVSSTMSDFEAIDKRAREYLSGGQTLMAADVIFTEGSQAAASAARQVEQARAADHEAFDARESNVRRQQLIALAAAAGLAALVVLVLAPAGSPSAEPEEAPARISTDADDSIVSHARPIAAAPAPKSAPTTAPPAAVPKSAPILKAAADLATDFGRVRDSDELARLLARAADMMDASGVVVWMGNAAGGDLKPILTHGYAAQVLAKMPSVPKGADNAAAAAYRAAALQIVSSRPGGANGAIVAPILSGDGCVGALSIEIRGGGETSEAIQSIAAIIAAHLAGILPQSSADAPAQTKAARA